MKLMLSILCLCVTVFVQAAEPPAKLKARAKAALALAEACEEVKPLKEAAKATVQTDLEEARKQAARENKPLVVWVATDPMDLDTAVHVRVDEHAGIRDSRAAVVYSVGGGKVSDSGHVEYQPTKAKVEEEIRKNTPPPPKAMPEAKPMPSPVSATAPTVSQFIVLAPTSPQIQSAAVVCVGST